MVKRSRFSREVTDIESPAKRDKLYFVDSLIIPLLDRERRVRCCIAIRHDIPDCKNAALELERLAEESRMASKAKTLFLQT